MLLTISAGGVAGALSRYSIGILFHHSLWSTWAINVTGCFLIGILMVLITRRWPQQLLIRPFWGVGVLGGYTTFSTASVDVLRAAPLAGLTYCAATLVGAVLAVWLGTLIAESVVRA